MDSQGLFVSTFFPSRRHTFGSAAAEADMPAMRNDRHSAGRTGRRLDDAGVLLRANQRLPCSMLAGLVLGKSYMTSRFKEAIFLNFNWSEMHPAGE